MNFRIKMFLGLQIFDYLGLFIDFLLFGLFRFLFCDFDSFKLFFKTIFMSSLSRCSSRQHLKKTIYKPSFIRPPDDDSYNSVGPLPMTHLGWLVWEKKSWSISVKHLCLPVIVCSTSRFFKLVLGSRAPVVHGRYIMYRTFSSVHLNQTVAYFADSRINHLIISCVRLNLESFQICIKQQWWYCNFIKKLKVYISTNIK